MASKSVPTGASKFRLIDREAALDLLSWQHTSGKPSSGYRYALRLARKVRAAMMRRGYDFGGGA